MAPDPAKTLLMDFNLRDFCDGLDMKFHLDYLGAVLVFKNKTPWVTDLPSDLRFRCASSGKIPRKESATPCNG